eukprot:m51a1_g3885 putative dna ligase 4 (896) ;mRNA; r:52842-56103
MKEANIAKLYVDILGISDQSEDGFRLLHWRRPAANTEAGDFGSAVYLSLRNRCQQVGSLSLYDVNQRLDELNAAAGRPQKAAVLKSMLRATTALEQKWIVRIVLKELRVGLSERSVLGYFHENALELLSATSSLRRVCEDLKNPSFRIDQKDSISLFHPIKPMLASRHPPDSIVQVMQENPFTKYDGERIQVHKDGDRVELFTRNCNNCTHIYGEKLAPVVRDHVAVSRCILDGELLVWDSILQRFEEFGRLKSFANYARGGSDATAGAGDNLGKQLCYVVFDVLYVADKPILELTLQQRHQVLCRIVTPKEKTIEIVQQVPARTTSDVLEALDAAILGREEGIMLKRVDSPYVPGERRDRWVKIKPEYVDGVGDDLDLLIVGGYFGKGDRRGGTISHFLVGVAPAREGLEPPAAFLSLGKVGSGYSDAELRQLQEELRQHWRHFRPEAPPGCLQLAEGLKERPDVWIEPQRSRVVRVKAAQLVPSDRYRAGVTLRFPRVVGIRTDRSWDDCMTLPELFQLMERFRGRYAKRQLGDVGGDGEAAAARPGRRARKDPTAVAVRRAAAAVAPIFRAADTSGVVVEEDTFGGRELCVLNGTADGSQSKQDLELLVARHGGKVVQCPTQDTFCAVAGRETVKVKNLMMQGRTDVVDPSWVLACVAERKFVPLRPKYMVHTTEDTKEKFLLEIDRFGDSFCEDATAETLREAFCQVSRQLGGRQPQQTQQQQQQQQDEDAGAPLSSSSSLPLPPTQTQASASVGEQGSEFDRAVVDAAAVEQHYFGQTWWAIFRSYVVYVDYYLTVGDPQTKEPFSPLESAATWVRFYGGTVVDEVTPETTHIVVDARDTSRVRVLEALAARARQEPPHSAKHIVEKAWVEESARLQEDLDEFRFYLSRQ